MPAVRVSALVDRTHNV